MVTWAPTWEQEITEKEVLLNRYSTDFLRVWISMMFYNSSSWLWKTYWKFVDDSWKFSKEKYETFLNNIIDSIRRLDINIPHEFDVNEILWTDIDAFTDTTNVSQSISDLHVWVNFLEDEDLVKYWIKDYYKEYLHELNWYAELVWETIDNTRELVHEIVEWLRVG